MDYGPFGFIEKYEALWNMWVGGGEHYAFMNQMGAAFQNFTSFVQAVVPLLDKDGVKEAQRIVDGFEARGKEATGQVWRAKLGLKTWGRESQELWEALEKLMGESNIDWTIFWRQLAELPAKGLGPESPAQDLMAPLKVAFYEESLVRTLEGRWTAWLAKWLGQLKADGLAGGEVASSMRLTSPKYVPREWILVEAYDAANKGDHSVVETLYKLFLRPFDEQPEFEKRFYKKAPSSAEELGGTAFMS
eukprot:gnl/TRDRNA2_/TRDRNA2_117577_c2_seq1.p1 gnl/TRDRNA2_/TRDRNA2_117577_c2~~gnl/TRDRNA2_/TRDRNA2_117577_c2_seq1.p1  ORF type:complete len:265 (+),score=56.63 gnl/TRDRNA2_/TRDRNA2_117577_c2_seq1:55-795(+)